MDGGTVPQGTPRSSLSTLLLVTFFIFMLSGSGEDPNSHKEMESVYEAMIHQSLNYSAWLNNSVSNFTLIPEPPTLSPLLHSVIPQTEPLDPSTTSYYHNITGFIHGDVTGYNLSLPLDPSLTWAQFAAPFIQTLNHTAAALRTSNSQLLSMSSVMVNLRETSTPVANTTRFFRGTMDVSNRRNKVVRKLEFDGVHLLETGGFHALVSPLGVHPDIRQLSALLPEGFRNSTMYAIQEELQSRVKKFRAMAEAASMYSDDEPEEDPAHQCTFIFRGQMMPSPIPETYMRELERESAYPTGVRTARTPPSRVDGVLVSEDCAFLVKLDRGIALSADRFWRKAITYSGLALIIYISLLVLTVNQMEWTRTPAAISKVSRWTFAVQAIADCYAFVAHITIGMMANNRASLSLIAPGFTAATLFLVFEVRYAALMHRIQSVEDAAAAAAAAPPPPPAPLTAAAAAAAAATRRLASRTTPDSLLPRTNLPPSPVGQTQSPTEPPFIFGNSWGSWVRSLGDPDSRTWIFALLIILVLIQAIVSSKLLLVALLLLHSFWIPQIIRNVRKGTRRALRKRYVFGTSLARMYFPLYALACPDNVLFTEPNNWVWVLCIWVWIQVLVLLGQEYIGAAFFFPKGWEHVKTYDYHALIPLPDPEAPDAVHNMGDCSVCLEPIVLRHTPDIAVVGGPVDKEASALLQSVSARSYSLAPCHHMFHTACLERWLGVKNICPVCRRHLPPL